MLSPVKLWRNQKQIAKHLGKKGRVVSVAKIRTAPSGFENEAPYLVAVAQFGKSKIVGQVVDHEHDLTIGQIVEIVIRRIHVSHPESVIPYGIKFRPVEV